MERTDGYRLFHLKVVPDDAPNDPGRWIERVVPDVWPGDDRAQPHMLRSPPDHDYKPSPGTHVVAIQEAKHGPSDQPGSMREAAGLPAGDLDEPPAPSLGMR